MSANLINDRLERLSEKSRVMSNHLVNLSNSLGIFQGLKSALGDKNVAGPGAHAITLILFDAMHLIAIRTHSFLVKSKMRDDVTMDVFEKALKDGELRNALIQRHDRDDLRQMTEEAIERTIRKFLAFDAEAMEKLQIVRNKMLAHATIKKITDFPDTPLVIKLAEKSLEVGHDIYEIFGRASFDYGSNTALAQRGAQHLIELMRSQPDEVRRRSVLERATGKA